jgi:LCP family protein required for cell wall assembly
MDQTPPGGSMPDEPSAAPRPEASSVAQPSAASVAGKRKAQKSHGFVRRHWLATTLTSILTIIVLLAGAAYGYYWYLNRQLDNIPRVDVGIKHQKDQNGNELSDTKTALNVLMVGVDNGDAQGSLRDDVLRSTWPIGSHRTDTIMLVHLPADHKTVSMISIPRDTWITMPDCAKYPEFVVGCEAKVNAAFSLGGPKLMVRAVQNLTGISLDHFIAIDWNGFKGLTTALGGIRVYVPRTFYDDSQKITWSQGWHKLEGQPALQYVRTRHGLANGDFDRIARQQNFLRATMKQLLSNSVRHNPIKFIHVANAITKYLTVDSGWSSSEMRHLALSLRGIGASKVTFMTLKTTAGWSQSTPPQSIQTVDYRETKQLFRAFARGQLTAFLRTHPDSITSLSGGKEIN